MQISYDVIDVQQDTHKIIYNQYIFAVMCIIIEQLSLEKHFRCKGTPKISQNALHTL